MSGQEKFQLKDAIKKSAHRIAGIVINLGRHTIAPIFPLVLGIAFELSCRRLLIEVADQYN